MEITTSICNFLADNSPYLNNLLTSINICPALSNGQLLSPQIPSLEITHPIPPNLPPIPHLDLGEKSLKEVLGTREVLQMVDQAQAEDAKPLSEMSLSELVTYISNLDINSLNHIEYTTIFNLGGLTDENLRRVALLNDVQKEAAINKFGIWGTLADSLIEDKIANYMQKLDISILTEFGFKQTFLSSGWYIDEERGVQLFNMFSDSKKQAAIDKFKHLPDFVRFLTQLQQPEIDYYIKRSDIGQLDLQDYLRLFAHGRKYRP